jgi:hypothetical protein
MKTDLETRVSSLSYKSAVNLFLGERVRLSSVTLPSVTSQTEYSYVVTSKLNACVNVRYTQFQLRGSAGFARFGIRKSYTSDKF